MKRLALSALVLGLAAVALPAAAQPQPQPQPPAAPIAGKRLPPSSLAVTSKSGPLARHIQRRAASLEACLASERRPTVKVVVRARWNRDGATLAVTATGGSARFNRCAAGMLRGWIADVAGRGSALARFTLTRPAPVPPPIIAPGDPLAPTPDPVPIEKPTPSPSTGALDACTTSDDCTIYFRTASCVASDPVAVNRGKLDLARKTYPLRHDPCGMGGPQYERLRRMNENRWSTTCEARRCVLHDAGLRDPMDPLDPLGGGK